MKTKSLHNQLVDWRHDLHMNPQISFEEEYASNKVSNLLKEFGIEVHQGIAKTGVVGVLKKGSSNKILIDKMKEIVEEYKPLNSKYS